jgi:hypothetical protein
MEVEICTFAFSLAELGLHVTFYELFFGHGVYWAHYLLTSYTYRPSHKGYLEDIRDRKLLH